MCQTLLFIPHEVLGIPVFGVGWLLGLWGFAVVVWIGSQYRKFGWGPETRDPMPFLLVAGLAIVFLMPKLESRAPSGLVLGLPVRGYGTFMLLGVIAGWWLAARRAVARGLNVDTIAALGFSVFLAGIVGARLFFVVEYWEEFRKPTWGATLAQILKFTEGGLVVYGSLIGGFIAYILFARRRRLPLLALGDVIAPGVILGMAIGRIGCLMNGCCYGGLSEEGVWGIRFPHFSSTAMRAVSPPYAHQLVRGQMHGFVMEPDERGQPTVTSVVPRSAAETSGLVAGVRLIAINGSPTPNFEAAQEALIRADHELAVQLADGQIVRWDVGTLPERSLPVHPAQVYSAISGFIICLVLLASEPYLNRDGSVFALLLTLYPIVRFMEELIRVDEPGQLGTNLSISQWISFFVLAGAAIAWYVVLRRPTGVTRFALSEAAAAQAL